MVLLLIGATPACNVDAWEKELWPRPSEVRFRPTTLSERQVFSELIPALLKAAAETTTPPDPLAKVAATVGFQLDVRRLQGEVFWVLREQPAHRRGAGAYVFRTGQATDDVVQAPHAYFDLGTGQLGLALFTCAPEGHRPRAFATNTAHRYGSRKGERRTDADHPADVAHNPDHLFQVVTDGFARALPRLRVFQVHGFSQREDEAPLAAVVSAGTRAPTPTARTIAIRLAPVIGEGVRLYPEQTELLGGTTNAQARLLRAWPQSQFIHLELSADARRALGTPDRIGALGAALFGNVEE